MRTLGYSIQRGLGAQVYLDSTFALPIQGTDKLACWDYRKGREGWWVVPADSLKRYKGKETRIPPPGAYNAVMSGNNLSVWIYRRGDELWRCWSSTGKEERVGTALPGDVWMFDVSMNGKEILWRKTDTQSKLVLVKNVFE